MQKATFDMTVQSRRVFLGSAAAAATAGAGSLWVNGNAPLLAQRAEPDDRLLIAELQRQAREGVKAMRTRPGEGVRRVATVLRTYAAHGRGRNIDREVAAQLRATMRRLGRDALLTRELDTTTLNHELREMGITREYTPQPVDVGVRAELLDALLNGGFTARLLQFADQLEEQAAQLDREGAVLIPARSTLVTCYVLSSQLNQAEGMILIFCNPALAGYYSAGCAFWSSYAATIWLQLYYYGC